MTDPIYDIIQALDKHLATLHTGKYYGLCELVNSNGDRFPVTCTTTRERINPADTWQLQIYHRLLEATRVPEEEFGRNVVMDQIVRMVIIANPNLGETLPLRILNSFPKKLITPGGMGVVTDATNLNSDHESIASTEFNTIPEDKHRLTKNLFVIEYTLRLQLCPPL